LDWCQATIAATMAETNHAGIGIAATMADTSYAGTTEDRRQTGYVQVSFSFDDGSRSGIGWRRWAASLAAWRFYRTSL